MKLFILMLYMKLYFVPIILSLIIIIFGSILAYNIITTIRKDDED